MNLRRQCDMGEFCPNSVDQKRIMELSGKLHVYDAIAGDGVRSVGEALRNRIEVLERGIRGVLRTDDPDGFEDRMRHLAELVGEEWGDDV